MKKISVLAWKLNCVCPQVFCHLLAVLLKLYVCYRGHIQLSARNILEGKLLKLQYDLEHTSAFQDIRQRFFFLL